MGLRRARLVDYFRTAVLEQARVPIQILGRDGSYTALWSIPGVYFKYRRGGRIEYTDPVAVEKAAEMRNSLIKNGIDPGMENLQEIKVNIGFEAYLEETSLPINGSVYRGLGVSFKNTAMGSGRTNTGGELKVFGAVIEAIRQVMAGHPEYVFITVAAVQSAGHTRPNNRVDLYVRLMKRFMPNFDVTEDTGIITAWKKKQA